VRLRRVRVCHELPIHFGTVKPRADFAFSAVGLDRHCRMVPSWRFLLWSLQLVLAFWIGQSPSELPGGRHGLHVWVIEPRCGYSNPHSVVVHSNRNGTSRSFLPRGLYDASPQARTESRQSVVAGWHPTNLNESGPLLNIVCWAFAGQAWAVEIG